jgi:hypothetical protein
LAVVAGAPWQNLALAAGAQKVVLSATVSAGDLFNGIVEFRVTSGGPVKLSLVVARDSTRIFSVAAAGGGFPSDGNHRIGKFDISDKTAQLKTYTVGGASVDVRLGERLLPNLDAARAGASFKGEYAVVTHVTATLVNPGPAPAQIALFESAHGGASTGSYAIDGTMLESGTMECKENQPPGYVPPRYKLCVYDLAPGVTKVSEIYTIPDNASSSPVVLTFDGNDATVGPGAGSIVQIDPPLSPARVA